MNSWVAWGSIAFLVLLVIAAVFLKSPSDGWVDSGDVFEPAPSSWKEADVSDSFDLTIPQTTSSLNFKKDGIQARELDAMAFTSSSQPSHSVSTWRGPIRDV